MTNPEFSVVLKSAEFSHCQPNPRLLGKGHVVPTYAQFRTQCKICVLTKKYANTLRKRKAYLFAQSAHRVVLTTHVNNVRSSCVERKM